jgi:hypothetical protein
MTSGRDYGGKGSTRRPINNREELFVNFDNVDISRKDSRTTTR